MQTDAGLFDVFAATFPGASITGAPKVNTAGFIADLERTPRGLYTGTIGAIPPDGDFEFNIAIRTAWVNTNLGRATYGVGGGVVWDSDPTAEWNEAHDKACRYRADRPFRLLESIAWTPECGSVLLERHLDRLAAATHFGFDVDLDEVRRTIESFNADEPQVIGSWLDSAAPSRLNHERCRCPTRTRSWCSTPGRSIAATSFSATRRPAGTATTRPASGFRGL